MAGGQLSPLTQMRLQQDKQLFAKYFRTNPELAHAIISAGGGNSSLLDNWVIQNYFNGDTTSYKNWVNTQFYTGPKNISYSPQTGQIVNTDTQQVMNPGYQSPLTNYYRYAGYNTFGRPGTPGQGAPLLGQNPFDKYGNINPNVNWGVMQGQPGQSGMPGVPNQFEGMQQLFRDNTGMLHDPGDNPVTTPPTTPGAPPQWWNPFPGAPQQNGQAGYNNNWRQGQMRNPNKTPGMGGMDRPNLGLPTSVVSDRNPGPGTRTPAVTTPGAAPPPAGAAPNPTTNPALFGRDPNDPYRPNTRNS